MIIGYVAVETFITTEEYRNWSKLFHVKEVVSFDCSLCPRILKYEDTIEEKILFELHESDIVNDLDYLLDKVRNIKDKQILAVLREPEYESAGLFLDKRFKFYGYDLIEDGTRISALTNCGGFDNAFSPNDISEYGLITDYDKARKIQKLLIDNYPNESHADCVLWAIWRMETGF